MVQNNMKVTKEKRKLQSNWIYTYAKMEATKSAFSLFNQPSKRDAMTYSRKSIYYYLFYI